MIIGEDFWGLPFWGIIVLVTSLLMGSHELGVQIRRRTRRHAVKDHDAEGVGGSYLTASLSLLALLMAFSFGMAVDRYNTRRNLVVQEANAIASAYRRLETVDESARAAISPAVLEYLAVRQAFSEAHDTRRLALTEARTETAQRRLWAAMVKALGAAQPLARSNLDATDRMFDVAASRRAALEAVVPATVLFGMLLYAVIAALLMGYSHPIDRRFLVPSSVQFVLLGIALALIVDIDRPRSGLVEVDQAPLLRAAASIRRAEAERPAAAPGEAPKPGWSGAAPD